MTGHNDDQQIEATYGERLRGQQQQRSPRSRRAHDLLNDREVLERWRLGLVIVGRDRGDTSARARCNDRTHA